MDGSAAVPLHRRLTQLAAFALAAMPRFAQLVTIELRSLVYAILFCFALAQGSGAETPRLRIAEAVELPAYDGDANARASSTREAYEEARADDRFVMERFDYESGDLSVGAYLYRPTQSTAPLPVVIFNRAGYVRDQDFASEILATAHRLAIAGFLVVAPHYRGSVGNVGRDEMGGADLADLMNLPIALAGIPDADTSRLFLLGEARGGMMTYQAIRDGFPARAAAVWGVYTDLGPLLAGAGPQARFAPLVWPDLETQREEIVIRRSPLRWADALRTPLLIMHGDADDVVPVEQARQLSSMLNSLGRRHELLVFAGGQNRLQDVASERDAAVIDWFSQFLRGSENDEGL